MDIFKKALQNIRERRESALRKAESCLATLRCDKEFAEIESKVAALEWEIAKREVYNDNYTQLQQDLLVWKEKYNKKLAEKNLTEEDITSCPVCKKCRGTGFVDGDYCECVYEEVKNLQYKKYPMLLNFPESIKGVDFSIYGEYRKGYMSRLEYLKENVFGGTISNFSLLGAPGIGKTYLALFLAKLAVENNKTIELVNAIKLNNIFLEYHLAPIEEKKEILSMLINCDLLVIDDLGVEQNLNNVTLPYLYQILIERLGKKTIITSNLSLGDIENKYDQRIFSRLADKVNSAVILFKGEDLRIK